jgi:hypothetical protein
MCAAVVSIRTMRRVLPLLAACVAATLTACGGGGAADPPARPLAQVHLQVSAPGDGASTRETSVTVRGTVEPAGASVRVMGQPAEVVGESFTADVDLRPGANVIDLAATAPHRGPVLTAFRVTREMPVQVPDLAGKSEGEARAAVEAVGLTLEVHDGGGLLDVVLPGSPAVCEQDPGAGEDVTRGTKVRVTVAKRC